MSQENVDVVQRALEAFASRDLEAMLLQIDSEAELHSAIIGGAEGNTYSGHEGFRRWYADSYETFEYFRFEWSEVRDLGDRVLTLGHVKVRGRESGAEIDSPMGWVYTVRRSKVLKAEGFLSRAEALEAAGLRE
jgi:ketosteroid isomerase-like protein